MNIRWVDERNERKVKNSLREILDNFKTRLQLQVDADSEG